MPTPNLNLRYASPTDTPDIGYWTQVLAEDVDTALGAAWTSTNPGFTASGGGVSLGASGLHVQRYHKAGKSVDVAGRLAMGGAGAALGSGTYTITLPVAASTVVNMPLSDVWVLTSSGWVRHMPVVGGSSFTMYFPNASGIAAAALAANSLPGGAALNTTLSIRYALRYEAS